MKKRRFFYIFLFFLYYRYAERFTNWIKTKRVRTINKYKRRWLARYNPEGISYQTAIDAGFYRPTNMSENDAQRLGEAVLKADRQLKNGCSRQLIINIMNRVRSNLNNSIIVRRDE
jgi:hypothetical protein